MTREDEILLAAARGEGDAGAAGGGGIDWDRLLASARRHGMVPLLHRHLGGGGEAPPEWAEALRAEYADGARRALWMAAELRRLLEALADGGVAALAYKGPALAVLAYGDLSMRTLSDLDLLVRPEDAPRAARLLAAQGFVPAYDLSPARARLYWRVDGDLPLHRERDGLLVELHARVASVRFGVRTLETGELAARARPVRVGGGEVPTLAPDDLLLALAVHGAKHRWARLEWVAAFAALLRRGEADVETLARRAEGAGARTVLRLALRLAHTLLGAPLPGPVRAAVLADPAAARLAAEAEAVLFADAPEDDAERAATAANLRFNLRAQDDARRAVAFAARWIFLPTPEDWSAVPLPDALFPLLRVVRPVRLLLRYGGRRGAG